MNQANRLARQGLRVAVLLIGVVTIVQAAPIAGVLTLGGQAETTQTTIDYTPFIPGAALNGTGNLVVTANGTGFFSPLLFADIPVIVDRSVVAGVVPAQPAGSPILVPDWLTFPTKPLFRYALDLTYISPGTFSSVACFDPPAVGQVCTPPAPVPFTSPYNLTNFFDGTRLSANANFSLRGLVRNIDTNLVEYTFDGIFGAEFQGISYQTILATVSVPDGAVLSGFSGTINVTAIPEPSTTVLIGMGSSMLALGLLRRRRRS